VTELHRRDADLTYSPGGRRSADAELWRPGWPDVASGNKGGVGSLALSAAQTTARAEPRPTVKHGLTGWLFFVSDGTRIRTLSTRTLVACLTMTNLKGLK
jgi:hypothetical protein